MSRDSLPDFNVYFFLLNLLDRNNAENIPEFNFVQTVEGEYNGFIMSTERHFSDLIVVFTTVRLSLKHFVAGFPDFFASVCCME